MKVYFFRRNYDSIPLTGSRQDLFILWKNDKKVKSESEICLVMSNSLWPCGLYSPWNSPGQNTGLGSLSLLQGIFPTQGSNPGLPHCRLILYHLSHKGSPRIVEWVAYPFSIGYPWPRNQTGISCIAGGFFTNWAMREALFILRCDCICEWSRSRATKYKVWHVGVGVGETKNTKLVLISVSPKLFSSEEELLLNWTDPEPVNLFSLCRQFRQI